MPKKIERGDSLVSPGMICYAEKQVKPFWSSSLGQMVLFDTIIFCRTFRNYFGQFVWIEKKRVTIIVAFHFMKRRLKMSKSEKTESYMVNFGQSSQTANLTVVDEPTTFEISLKSKLQILTLKSAPID